MMRHLRGYTLIELLLAMAIAGILLTLSIPYWQSFRNQHLLEIQTNRLLDSIQLARNTAMSLQTPVNICPSDDGKTCVDISETGWIIFTISQKDKLNAETIIRNYNLADQCKIKWQGMGQYPYVQFNPQGNAQGYNGSFNIIVNNVKNTIINTVIVSPTGRARLA